MLTYADGVFLYLESGRERHLLRSVSAFGRTWVEAEHRQLLIDLLFGLDDSWGHDSRLEPLLRRQVLAHKQSLDDPLIEAQLDTISAQWSWQRPPGVTGQRYDRLLRQTRRAHARRKVFVQDFGQTPCLPETAVRRALLAGTEPRRVLCIGDDDLVSVPLAMLGHEVTVYDIDGEILIPLLNGLAAEWQLPLRAERRDLMQPQPRRVPHRFDLLFTDPMSTRECFDLFLSRGMARLKVGGRAFCCVHPLALETFRAVQQDMRFGLRRRMHDFNHYYEEDFLENYYRSDLMELEKLRETTPVFPLAEPAAVNILGGELINKQHQCCDVIAVKHQEVTLAHVEAAIARIKESGLLQVAAEQRHEEERVFSYIAALRGGGYLGLTAFFDEPLVAYDIYPFQPARDFAIREAMMAEIPHTCCLLIHRVARSHALVRGPT